MKKIAVQLLLICIPLGSYAQTRELRTSTRISEMDKISAGIGFGLDYGGIGGNITCYPHRNIGLFGGVGYNFALMGWSLGTKIRLVGAEHRSNASAYLLAMYGTNASSNLQQGPLKGLRTFRGVTVGVGVDLKYKITSRNYWSLSINVPFRSNEYSNFLKTMDRYNYKYTAASPVAFSLGYRFCMR